jgi:hypothetical protein
MARSSKSKKSPSRKRYEEEHPTITGTGYVRKQKSVLRGI